MLNDIIVGIKNEYGQGTGKDYKPFIQAHDNKVASEGWLARHYGWKTYRPYRNKSCPQRLHVKPAEKVLLVAHYYGRHGSNSWQ
jgi:hypothetical protein